MHGDWMTCTSRFGPASAPCRLHRSGGVLRHQRGRHQEWAKKLGVDLTNETPVLTCNLERPISPDTVSHYVRKIATRAGVDTYLHGLRHYAATQILSVWPGNTDP